MISLRDMPNTMFAVHPAGHEKAGQTVEREATCECGRVFTQMRLSDRELEAAERMGVIRNLMRQIPALYVPVHCPPCERADLGRQCRVDEARSAATVPDRRTA